MIASAPSFSLANKSRVKLPLALMVSRKTSSEGALEIVNGWDQGLRDITAIHHQSGNFIIDLNGEKASASCYGIAIHYLPNASQRNTRTFVGSYDFDLVRVQERWKIATFRFNLKFIDGNRDLK